MSQAQGVAELMGSYNEEDVAYSRKHRFTSELQLQVKPTDRVVSTTILCMKGRLTCVGTEGEGLIIIKMSIPSEARKWGEGVSELATRAVKGVIISMIC